MVSLESHSIMGPILSHWLSSTCLFTSSSEGSGLSLDMQGDSKQIGAGWNYDWNHCSNHVVYVAEILGKKYVNM